MPAITATTALNPGSRVSARTTLTATGNPFTYASGQGGLLILHNPTGGALSPTITGSTAAAQVIDQVGLSVNFAAGFAVGSIVAGAQVLIPLASIDPYLRGTIDITGGTGLVATHIIF
jgi:hypothetical protein